MSRRIQTYRDGYGFNLWNMVSTIGSLLIAVSVLVLIYNVVVSRRDAKTAPNPGPDPWDARSLEWSVPSPTPDHNFDDDPVVTRFDDFWHRKYTEDEAGRPVKVADGADVAMIGDPSRAHLPSPSYWPIVLAFGLPLIGYGLIFNLGLAFLGGLIVLVAFVAWGLEPTDDPENPHGHGDDGHDGPDGPEGPVTGADADADTEAVGTDAPATDTEVAPVD